MSEQSPWASPGGGPQQPPGRPPVPAQAPRVGQPPPFGQQPPFAQPGPGWAPPPKPGLIPLRPLGVGDILGAAFRVFRRNPLTTFGTALLFQGIVFVLTVAAGGGSGYAAYRSISGALPSQRDAVIPGAIAGVFGALLVPLVLQIAVGAVLQGLFVIETSHQVIAEKMRLGGLWRQARGRVWPLIGWILLLIAAVGVAITVVFVAVVVLVAVGGTVGAVVGTLIGILATLVVIALSIWIGTKTILVPSILVLERLTLGRAIARSWRLTKNGFWKTFGVIALAFVIVQAASSVASAPVTFLGQIGAGILQPNGSSDSADAGAIVSALVVFGLSSVVNLVIGAIGAVIQSAATALVYIDLRIRREGLDLDLIRYVELRGAGHTGLSDPYLPRAVADSPQTREYGPPDGQQLYGQPFDPPTDAPPSDAPPWQGHA